MSQNFNLLLWWMIEFDRWLSHAGGLLQGLAGNDSTLLEHYVDGNLQEVAKSSKDIKFRYCGGKWCFGTKEKTMKSWGYG